MSSKNLDIKNYASYFLDMVIFPKFVYVFIPCVFFIAIFLYLMIIMELLSMLKQWRVQSKINGYTTPYLFIKY